MVLLFHHEGGSPATPGDQPRRSARLTSKIRSLFDGLGHDSEVKQPSQKRSRKSRDHVKEKTVGEFHYFLEVLGLLNCCEIPSLKCVSHSSPIFCDASNLCRRCL